MTVSPASSTSVIKNNILVAGDIVNYLFAFCVLDKSSARYKYNSILTVCTVEFRVAAVSSVLCNEFSFVTEREESVGAFVDTEDYISPVSAVSTVRTALCYIFFTSERYDSVSAVSCFCVNFNFIYKHNQIF